MRVFMRVRAHVRVHACVHIHPALNAIRCFGGAGKSRGRLYVNFYTTDFTSRGAFVCPTLPAPRDFYGLHIRNPGITQVHYSLRRRGIRLRSSRSQIHWRIWYHGDAKVVRASLPTPANVSRRRREPGATAKLIKKIRRN